VDKALPAAFYRVAGFHPCGVRAVRIDMLERLADLIRPLVAWRPDPANANSAPKGATGDGGFRVTPEMMSILGCSSSNVGEVLQELGFRLERVPVRPAVRPEAPASEAPASATASPEEDPTAGADVVSAAEAWSGVDASPHAGSIGAPADGEGQPASPTPETLVPEADCGEAASAGEAAPTVEIAGGDVPTPGQVAATAVAASPETPAAAPAAAEQESAAEPKFEEIWRPRRQGRHHERGERSRHRRGPPPAPIAQTPARTAAEAGENGHPRRAGEGRDGRPRRHGRNDQQERHDRQDRPARTQGRLDRKERRHGSGRRDDRREDRQPRVFRHSASPAPKPGVDPDSPFAALSSLKAALEKQSQE
jgi:ATP-dependent RNA helicase SUPV3L1/SUV3